MTTPLDLYAILGVGPQHTIEAVRAAWREKVKRCHPDGPEPDEEKFRQVQLAYEVLSDPERRKLYDETGVYDEKASKDDKLRKIAIGIVSQMFETVMAQFIENDGGKVYNDVPKAMAGAIRERIEAIEDDIRKMGADLAKLKAFKPRFELVEGKTDVIGNLLYRRIEGIQNQLPDAVTAIEIHKLAIEIVEGYRFTADAPGAPQPGATTFAVLRKADAGLTSILPR